MQSKNSGAIQAKAIRGKVSIAEDSVRGRDAGSSCEFHPVSQRLIHGNQNKFKLFWFKTASCLVYLRNNACTIRNKGNAFCYQFMPFLNISFQLPSLLVKNGQIWMDKTEGRQAYLRYIPLFHVKVRNK